MTDLPHRIENARPEDVRELLGLEATARNVYRLQVGGLHLCNALRKIAERPDASDAIRAIAMSALEHKMPDPPEFATIAAAAVRAKEPTT